MLWALFIAAMWGWKHIGTIFTVIGVFVAVVFVFFFWAGMGDQSSADEAVVGEDGSKDNGEPMTSNAADSEITVVKEIPPATTEDSDNNK